MSELKLRCVLHEQHTKGQQDRAELALQEIVEGMEAKVGEQFFASLVQQLAATLGVGLRLRLRVERGRDVPPVKRRLGQKGPASPFQWAGAWSL